MEHREIGGGGGGNKGGEGFIDRSKVRILLCDNDTKSSHEVFTLLCNCSYQVTPVRSARQVIDALNVEGPDIDIILTEVDLPMAKGTKMLKYITRDKGLHRIPVIMMSALDEVSVVVKCLRLGAADYLVKPLRTNELLNLWTHMWRRRRMLGLAEKNILTYDFDLVASDPSDANTNSTTLFSDDTDERSRKTSNLEASLSIHQEDESTGAATVIVAAVTNAAVDVVKPPVSMEFRPKVPGIGDHTGKFLSGPKKNELRVGGSSAFFSYARASIVKNNAKGITHAVEDELRVGGSSALFSYGKSIIVNSNAKGITHAVEDAVQHLVTRENLHASGRQVPNATWMHDDGERHSRGDKLQFCSAPDYNFLERSYTQSMSQQLPNERNSNEDQSSQVLMHTANEPQVGLSGFPSQNAYPYYMSGMANEVTVSPSPQLYPKNTTDLQNSATSAMVLQYNHLSQCHPPGPGMSSFPYYPVSICLPPGQIPTSHPWPSFGSSSPTEAKSCIIDRRQAALIKFRKKRKERCFDKKIRYVNRKKLAERRPRVRGQFVRKGNGVDVDLNDSVDFDEDEEEYEEQASRDSSPENDGSGYK